MKCLPSTVATLILASPGTAVTASGHPLPVMASPADAATVAAARAGPPACAMAPSSANSWIAPAALAANATECNRMQPKMRASS